MEEIDVHDMENGNQAVIEKYLRNELPSAERLDFERKMAADDALKQEVDLYARAFRAVQLKGREALKAYFREKDKIWLGNNPQPTAGKKQYKWAGLGVLLLMLIALLFWLNDGSSRKSESLPQNRPDSLEKKMKGVAPQDTAHRAPPVPTDEKTTPEPIALPRNTPTDRQLFAAHFQPYRDETLNPSVRASNDALTPFDRFQQAYWENRHQDALAAFEALSPALKNNDNVLFIKANSMLATGQAADAAILLEKIIAGGRTRYQGEAQWYLALAYLNIGKREETVSLLKVLARDKRSAKHDEAKKLLEKIE